MFLCTGKKGWVDPSWGNEREKKTLVVVKNDVY